MTKREAQARHLCLRLLEEKDRSAYILAKYIPAQVADAFVGLRAFNIETRRVVDAARDRRLAQVRLNFWKAAIQQIHEPASEPDEPVTALLHHAATVEKISVPKRYLLKMVQTREQRLALRPFRNIEDMESYGEGTFSQVLYAVFEALLQPVPETRAYLAANNSLDQMATNALAHLGQCTGIAELLLNFEFYATRHNFVNLPVDVLRRLGVSEQALLDAADANTIASVKQLSEVVYETATTANDHLLAARNLLKELCDATGAIPRPLVLAAVNALPTVLFLEALERKDFNLGRLTPTTWRLPWRSWRAVNVGMI